MGQTLAMNEGDSDWNHAEFILRALYNIHTSLIEAG